MNGNFRIVYTRFWSDNFISNLDPLDRYVFLYLLTNEHTNIAGIYELPIRLMEFETGLERETLKVILGRLLEKIDYHEGWIIIRNFPKYQKLLKSPKVRIAIKKILDELPEKLIGYLGGMDRVWIGYTKDIASRVDKIRQDKNRIVEENTLGPTKVGTSKKKL